MAQKRALRWVAVSGGFDPIHIGHVRMMRRAKRLGDKLVVILNNDAWLRNKKGFAFMPEGERKELILSLPFVDKVVLTQHSEKDPDRSVTRALRKLRPAIFANGGDRFADNIPEAILCKELGIKMVFNIGEGGKVQSSSWMIKDAVRGIARSVRPWGEFYDWDTGGKWHLKSLYIQPGKRLSLQYHNHRKETWLVVEGVATATVGPKRGPFKKHVLKEGDSFIVPKSAVHRLESKKGCVIVEVSFGAFDEEDIVRIDDDFGRVQ